MLLLVVVHYVLLVPNFIDNEVAGISSYVSNPDEAGQSLQSCITSTAEKLIPSYLRNRSPIYLGATAGMRLLK